MPLPLTQEAVDQIGATGAVEGIWRSDPSLVTGFDSFYVVVLHDGVPAPALPQIPGVCLMPVSRRRLTSCGDGSFGRIALKDAERVWP
jgi:hypothetical protein